MSKYTLKNLTADLKFQVKYAGKRIGQYLADLGSALTGRTRKQAEYLDGLLDNTITAIARISSENVLLKRRIAELESKPKALKKIKGETTAKKNARPKKSE